MLAYTDVDSVVGWLEPEVVPIIAAINKIQEGRVRGNIVEIGICYGKFFLIIASCVRPGERCFAIDLFDDQEQNTSNSGYGSLRIFTENLDKILPNLPVCIVAINSLHLQTSDALFSSLNDMQVRMFSVDGGHGFDEVLNDLYVAHRVLHKDGVIIIDDFQHSYWPDVYKATMAFLKSTECYTPIAMGGNKLLICRRNAAHLYNLPSISIESYMVGIKNQDAAEKAKSIYETYSTVALFKECESEKYTAL